MTTPVKITVGTKDFAIFSNPTSAGDPAVWRYEDLTKVPMLRPIIRQTVSKNSKGTNINVTVKASIPIVETVNSVQQSTNTAIATASITSLQNSLGSEVSDAVDSLIAALTALKANIVAGRTT